jgi:hypothetical protein
MKRSVWAVIAVFALGLIAFAVHHKMNQSAISVPANPADILAETEKHLQVLAASVQKQDATQVHQHDVAVRKLIAHLPQHAAPDSKAQVNVLVKEIADGAKTAHKLAHDDAWSEAAEHVKRTQASLAKLKGDFREIPH